MNESEISRHEYVRRILAAYRATPDTTGHLRREDRRLAGQLYDQQVPLSAVEDALVLATARRLLRPEGAPPLAAVRSMHYYRAVIDEVLDLKVSRDYFRYLRGKIEEFIKTRSNRRTAEPAAEARLSPAARLRRG